jgi:quinol monooxygenase YgiN
MNKLWIFTFFILLLGVSDLTYSQNVQVFVRHEVKDYKVWKKGYDDYAAKQKEGGVYYQHVYQTIDNPNQVTVIHDFHSLEKAKAFFASDDLKSTMKKIGALGKPEIWFVQLDKSSK